MESNTPLVAAPKPSLIVKLRYQPLCATCADMLPRWCDPHEHYSSWKWTLDAFKQKYSTCHCCRFIVQALKASPWIRYKKHHQIRIRTTKLGSEHISLSSETTEFRTYYRPKLYVVDGFKNGDNFAIILPVPQLHDGASNEHDTQTFCGRPVNAMADLSLIVGWYKTCTLRHQDLVNGHSCSPQTHESIQDFRVINVQKRCVVRASVKVEYAALSYVWGNAKRLILCKDNEAWLSTPDALAQDAESVPKTFRDALEIAAALGIAHLWVDALCIDQTNPEQVKHHMDAMDTVYGSAILTIVSTAENADSGLPGISIPRGPPQAVFQRNGTRYLSSKPTFGAALRDSPWEKRAWCLQEKLFSTRLLVFTDTQAFYHCGAATWFEDTIMELRESNDGAVYIREKEIWSRKQAMMIGMDEVEERMGSRNHGEYDSHRSAFKDRNFWSLVESYSKREMSFETDVIRAFGGILRSVEAQHGHALWGIPQYHFLRGLSWYHGNHQMSLRREGFPSWSWVGWRTRDSYLAFANCKRKNTDIGVSGGRYGVARGKRDERSVWDLSWYYHALNEHDDQIRTMQVQLEPSDRSEKPQDFLSVTAALSATAANLIASVAALSTEYGMKYRRWHKWGTPGHPINVEPAPEMMPPLVSGPEMPPLSHILRFYTSVATVLVHPQSIDEWGKEKYRLLVPGTDIEIAKVDLDSLWSGIGKSHSVVYISRYCPEYTSFSDWVSSPLERLHLLLIESMPGWGEVKRRVQLVKKVSILDWRKANPKWELVSLG